MINPGMFIADRYEIIDKVGSGGMADVYKARCHKLNRFVAIKVLKPEFSNDRGFVAKFRGEAQSAAGLSHPNIVSVYDVGEDDGLYYIVMELIEGITLKSFIERKGRLDFRETVGIGIQIAQGIEAAHNNNIIHRDIKPQNIMISKDGKVKVADFGIAKATTSNTLTSNAMGSVHYISPEQARGGFNDEKSDIYSLGITLYEMVSGMLPFEGDSAVSIALLHIQAEARTLGELIPGVPRSIDRIVQKCMQKKPERRYLSAAELIADLKRAIMDPNGDFVRLSDGLVDNSPTISLSQQDMNAIRNGANQRGYNQEARMNEDYHYDDDYDDRYDDYNDDYNDDYDDRYNNGFNDYDDYNDNYDEQEDSDEETVDPKVEKIAIWGSIAVVVAIIITFVFVIINVMGGSNSSAPESSTQPEQTVEASASPTGELPTALPIVIDVPKILGDKQSVAQEKLEKLKLKCEVVTEASDTVPAECVIRTSPEVGKSISEGETVIIYVSTGTESVTLKNVSNMSKSDAESALKSQFSGINIVYAEETSETVDEGKVIKTQPEGGSLVNKNLSEIKVIVSSGSGKAKVPNLMGYTEAEAQSALKEAGLLCATKEAYNDSQPKGKVVSQDYKAGSTLPKGHTVTITISKGEEETYTYPVTIAFDKSHNPLPEPEEDDDGTTEYEIEITVSSTELSGGSVNTSYVCTYNDFGTKTKNFNLTKIQKSNFSKKDLKIVCKLDGKTLTEGSDIVTTVTVGTPTSSKGN